MTVSVLELGAVAEVIHMRTLSQCMVTHNQRTAVVGVAALNLVIKMLLSMVLTLEEHRCVEIFYLYSSMK
jgi:hypothetical protein